MDRMWNENENIEPNVDRRYWTTFFASMLSSYLDISHVYFHDTENKLIFLWNHLSIASAPVNVSASLNASSFSSPSTGWCWWCTDNFHERRTQIFQTDSSTPLEFYKFFFVSVLRSHTHTFRVPWIYLCKWTTTKNWSTGHWRCKRKQIFRSFRFGFFHIEHDMRHNTPI